MTPRCRTRSAGGRHIRAHHRLVGLPARSRRLDELHPIAVRVLHHTHHKPGTRLRPWPHDLLTGRSHRAEHVIQVMDGHRKVAVPGAALNTARRRWGPWVLDRHDQLDQTLPEPQAVHHLDTYVL